MMVYFILLSYFLSLDLYSLEMGAIAPDFTLTGEDNKEHSLSDYSGKIVVLEWYNNGCPFVRKHYDSMNMQMTQEFSKSNGAIWLSIVSSAPGNQGHLTQEVALQDKVQNKSFADHILLDPSGDIGRLYNAKTPPHMFLIGEKGKIIYQGAIDSINSTDIKDIKHANNYIKRVLNEIIAERGITIARTRPYGCSVKY